MKSGRLEAPAVGKIKKESLSGSESPMMSQITQRLRRKKEVRRGISVLTGMAGRLKILLLS